MKLVSQIRTIWGMWQLVIASTVGSPICGWEFLWRSRHLPSFGVVAFGAPMNETFSACSSSHDDHKQKSFRIPENCFHDLACPPRSPDLTSSFYLRASAQWRNKRGEMWNVIEAAKDNTQHSKCPSAGHEFVCSQRVKSLSKNTTFVYVYFYMFPIVISD
jgi:hypothetical protein